MESVKMYRIKNSEGMYFKYNYFMKIEYEWVDISNAHLFRHKQMAVTEAGNHNAEVEECVIVSAKDWKDTWK
jgi:hypothetical protein